MLTSISNDKVADLAGVAAAARQGQGGLGQEEEEQEDVEQGARLVPGGATRGQGARLAPASPHQQDQGGRRLVTTPSLPSTCQLSSLLPTGAPAPLAHVSGAESLLAHQEKVHF